MLLGTFSLFGQKSAATCEMLSKINTLLQKEHYQPKPVDDSLSVYVFDAFIDGLDPDRYLFTKTDYEKLKQNRLKIDDAIRGNDCAFFNEFAAAFKFGLQRKKNIIEKISKTPLDYHSTDSVKFSRKSFPFDLAETDLERVWKKRLRYEILEEIASMSTNLDSLKQNFTSIEKDVKARVFETNLCKINSILNDKNGFENKLQSDFYNVFCSWFDPHSNYFTMDAKSSFMSGLNTSNLSLGLDFEMNEKQEIVVSEIIPGGPAARSEQIQKDDVIIKVANQNGKSFLVSCTTPDEIGEIIYSDENKEIDITIRKKNGALQEVCLIKQVMKAINNSVYSFVVEKDSRVGYIKIPSFYSDFENNSVTGCADDVAREILKLQQEKVSGLIIDVLDNGGGSMEEAVKLTGMFTDYGPISILSDNKNNQQIIRDLNRGFVFAGPIVILVNGNTASASEFFAAGMQDYKRAVIAGATTLGKASMQSILPLDEKDPKDFVKVTLEKFYRITGDSHQRKGVVPDVALPVLFDSIMPREKSYKTALAYDVIEPKARFRAFPSRANASVIASSISRVKSDTTFIELENINKEINLVYNDPRKPIALTLENFFTDVHKTDVLTRKIENIAERTNDCKITNTNYEQQKIGSDTYLTEINAYEMADVQHNLYLGEALNIIKDFNDKK